MEIIRPRNIVAYFEHEFGNSDPIRDVAEIDRYGFNTVVVCVSELTVDCPSKLDTLKVFTESLEQKNMAALADPWGVAKVFGGEGKSVFAGRGQTPCYCNPEFDALMRRWIDTVQEVGVDGIFWDEPDVRCHDHNIPEFLQRYTDLSKEKGLYNSVCLTSNPAHHGIIEKVASLPGVDDIATDPYYPNAFYKVEPCNRKDYVAYWACQVVHAAEMHGKDFHVWQQLFDIRQDDLDMIGEFNRTIKAVGVRDIAFWGYKGCKSLFPPSEGKAPADAIWKKAGEVVTNLGTKSHT